MNHAIGRVVFAVVVSSALALYVYQRASDPQPKLDRQEEERIVLLAREGVRDMLATTGTLDIVDPLAPNRVAGKVYVYPASNGWEVSGHYRRAEGQAWHPWLMRLDTTGTIQSLAVRDDDPQLIERAGSMPALTVRP